MIVIPQPFVIAVLMFCALFILYLLVKLIVGIVRYTLKIIKFLILGSIRITQRVINMCITVARKGFYYIVRVTNRVVSTCNQGILHFNHRFRQKGTVSYPIPSPYYPYQTKDLESTYNSSSKIYSEHPDPPIHMISEPQILDNTSFTTSMSIENIKQVESVRFCQICGAHLDPNESPSNFSIICRECGSDLSLGIDPICRKPVILGEDAVSCPHCHTVFHRHHVADWASSHGRCPFCQEAILETMNMKSLLH